MTYPKYKKLPQPDFDIYDHFNAHKPLYPKPMLNEIGKLTWTIWARTLSLTEIKELMKEMALYIQAEEIQTERHALHKKYMKKGNKHTPEDQKRSDYLFNLLMDLPTGQDKEDREGRKLLREAVKLLKNDKQDGGKKK